VIQAFSEQVAMKEKLAKTKTNSILIVDDDSEIREMLEDYLTSQSYSVETACDGETMREVLKNNIPDLVLLDIGLPGEDGFSLAKYLRQNFNLGVIMVTGANTTVDRIVGLELGADDYIVKPFDLRELLARTRSVLRRYSENEQSVTTSGMKKSQVKVGNYLLDIDSRRLSDKKNNDINITNMEFELLQVFINNQNKVLSRDNLLNLTKNRDWDPFDRSIDIHIARLRQKIEDNPKTPQVIKTVRGAGYIFVSEH